MITSLSEDIAHRKANLQQYEILINRVNKFVDNLGDKIENRIEKHKQKYLEEYKEKVSLMTAELKAIRAVLDEEQLRQRSNQRLFHLEEQRDFFRAQVIKLNEDLRKAKQENSKLKTELIDTKHEEKNYRKKIYKLTYQNLQMQKIKMDNVPTANQTLTSAFPMTSKKELPIRSNEKALKESQRQNDFQSNYHQKTQYSLRKLKPSRSLAGGSTPNLQKVKLDMQPSKREQILDSCIKEIKKQIYYRNLSTKDSTKIHFDESSRVSFDKFTKSDKKELVFKFMSNPEILEGLYQFVFDRRKQKQFENSSSQQGLQKLMIAKGVDPKFNTKMLLSYKTEFDKKIYDIKANRF